MLNEMHYKKETLVSTAQALTANFADLGSELNALSYRTAVIYLDVDINDSENVTIKPLSKLTEAASDEYDLAYKTNAAANVTVDALTYELNVDADQKICFSVDIESVAFLQFQVKAGVAGANPGNINDAYVVLIH